MVETTPEIADPPLVAVAPLPVAVPVRSTLEPPAGKEPLTELIVFYTPDTAFPPLESASLFVAVLSTTRVESVRVLIPVATPLVATPSLVVAALPVEMPIKLTSEPSTVPNAVSTPERESPAYLFLAVLKPA